MNQQFCFTVLEQARLEEPADVLHAGFGVEVPKHAIFSLTPECIVHAMGRPCLGFPGTVRDKLEDCFALCGGNAQPNSIIPLPYPLGQLVMSGWFSTLGLDARVRIADCHIFPMLMQLRQTATAAIVPPQPIAQLDQASNFNKDLRLIAPSMFSILARDLQRWAPSIIQEGLADEDHVNNYLHWLSDCSGHMTVEKSREWAWNKSKGRGGRWVEDFGEHGSFKPLFLIQCVFFAFTVRGASNAMGPDPLKAALSRALRTLPPVAQGFLSHLLKGTHYPGPSTMTRARLYVDVTWMLHMQTMHTELIRTGSIFFSLSDSSPQGGRNWCMHEYFCISGSMLLDVADAVFAMQRAGVTPAADVDDAGNFRELMQGWMRFVKDNIFHHQFPPTAFGVGHKGLSHNLHATFHGMRLENVSWDSVREMTDLTFSHCSDRGTEAKLIGKEVPLHSYFPYWMSLDINALAADDPMAVDHGPAMPESVAFRKTLDVPGTYHAIDNMQKRALDKLPRWDDEMKPIIEAGCRP